MSDERNLALADALWRLYRRPQLPEPWTKGGNLPWNDPDFSARMLREHLDQSHSAASRTQRERVLQVDWLWQRLQLQPGVHVLDLTCGPGLYAVELAQRGCSVTGIDFGPASIAHARELAHQNGVADRCQFIEMDVREADLGLEQYDAALFIYGQLSVFQKEETAQLLSKIARSLRSGGRLCVELLDQERIDKEDSTWWYTDDTGLWGDAPFLHLGERIWDDEQQLSTERFTVIHLETAEVDEIYLSDQSYSIKTMQQMMREASFAQVDALPAWDGLDFDDADTWVVYLATM